MKVIDADETWIHGGSLRVFICHGSRSESTPTSRLNDLLTKEAEAGILNLDGWASFGDRARLQKAQLKTMVDGFLSSGNKVAGYGASGKGQTMFNFVGSIKTLFPSLPIRARAK